MQTGSAIIWALIFVAITSGLVVSHTTFMASRRADRDARYNRAELAATFARSGLQDAVSWFHSRSNQPITSFEPVNDPHARPPRIETIDPTIGLVREFEIRGNLWGRYEVSRDAVRDVSAQRGNLVPGSAWDLGVRAYVFRRRDAARSFREAPNELIGTKALSTEIRWLQLNLPAAAALCAESPDLVTIGARGKVEGGSAAAIAYHDPATMTTAPATTTPVVNTGGTVSGAPANLPATVYDTAAERVFGMRVDELRAYSDVSLDRDVGTSWDWSAFLTWLRNILSGSSTTTASSDTPTIENKLIVAKGLRIDGKLVLSNSVLVVEGDLTTGFTADARIDGLVYVTGNALLDKGKVEINGSLVVRGTMKLGTGFSSGATVRYDAAKIDVLRRTVGKYRMQRGRNPQ